MNKIKLAYRLTGFSHSRTICYGKPVTGFTNAPLRPSLPAK